MHFVLTFPKVSGHLFPIMGIFHMTGAGLQCMTGADLQFAGQYL